MSCNCGQNWSAAIQTSCNDPASRESVVAALETLSQNCCVGELIVSGQSPLEDAVTAFAAGFPDGVASCTCDCVWLYNSVDNILFVNCTDEYTTSSNWFMVGQEHCHGILTTVGLSPDTDEPSRLAAITEAFPNGLVSGCDVYYVRRKDGILCYSTDDGANWTCLQPVVVNPTDWFPITGYIRLTGAAANIDIQNIPADYKHLVLVTALRTDAAQFMTWSALGFNNDYNNIYHQQNLSAVQNTVAATQSLSQTFFTMAHSLAGTSFTGSNLNSYPTTHTWIHNYTDATKPKIFDYRVNSGVSAANLFFMYQSSGLWHNNTNQINRITLTPAAGNYIAGSTYMLFGVGEI